MQIIRSILWHELSTFQHKKKPKYYIRRSFNSPNQHTTNSTKSALCGTFRAFNSVYTTFHVCKANADRQTNFRIVKFSEEKRNFRVHRPRNRTLFRSATYLFPISLCRLWFFLNMSLFIFFSLAMHLCKFSLGAVCQLIRSLENNRSIIIFYFNERFFRISRHAHSTEPKRIALQCR